MTYKVSRAGLAILLAIAIVGCTAQQWFQLVGALLPLAADVAVQFGSFANKGVLPAGEAAAIQKYSGDVQLIFSDIGADVAAWKTNPTATRLAHITALLGTLKMQSTALISQFGISDANTLAFITAIIQDGLDLTSLIPVATNTPVAGKLGAAEMRMKVSLPKAQSLQDVFKARLANLPK